LGDTVRTSFPAPNDVDAVVPFRGPGGVSSCTDQRHRWCGHPLVDLRLPSTFSSANEVVAHLGFATACFSLGLRRLGSYSTSSRRRAPASFRMPSPSVPGLTSSFRVLPETRRRAFGCRCSTTSRLGPSHGVLLPSAVASTKDPVFCPGTSTSPAVASSGFLPSRRLDPLRAFPTFLPGPLLGLLPSGLYSSRRSGFSFENSEPSWLCLT